MNGSRRRGHREPLGGGIPRSAQILRARRKSISRCRGMALERSSAIPRVVAALTQQLRAVSAGGAQARGASRADDELERFAVGGLRDAGVLTEAHRELAALILSTRGYVIFKDALAQDFIRSIGREVSEIYEDCRATHGRC